MKTYAPLHENLSDNFNAEHNLLVISRAADNVAKIPPVEIVNLTGSLDNILHDLAAARGGQAITNIHQYVWELSKLFVEEVCEIVNDLDEPENYDVEKLIRYANSVHDNKNEFLAELERICELTPMTERSESFAGHCRDAIAAELAGHKCMFLPDYMDGEFYSLETFATPQGMFEDIAASDHHGFYPGALVVLTSDEEVSRFVKTGGKLASEKDRKDILTELTDFVKENQERFPLSYKELSARSASDDHSLSQ